MQTTIIHLICFAVINLMVVLLGYRFINRAIVFGGWLMLVASILIIHLLFLHQAPLLRMLAIIATTFTAMKPIAVAEGYKHKPVKLTFKQWFVFALGWAGMRAQPFETLGEKPLLNAWPMIRFGISRIIIGLILIAAAHGVVHLKLSTGLTYILVSGMLLVGFSLILHFGALSISAGSWRLKGANTYLLFRQPAKTTSLTELWSKRWNIAFSEMTAVAVFRPIKSKFGNATALMAGFIFSGLLHELALSVPVNSGYGLPTLYFIIQGIMVLVENILAANKITILQNKYIAHIWVFFWLIIPMPLLFHAQFIRKILWPLAGLHI